MDHLVILPILLPMFAGALLLLSGRASEGFKRSLCLLATLLQLPLAIALMAQASGGLQVYAAGNWMPPFGIVLVVDHLAALLLLVTAVLAIAAVVYAVRGDDLLGANFHALFQFQLMGINGAFLTGDLFNLFVFFEILLIASYALLLHGTGSARIRSGLHYVLLNLFGSALFLIAIGTLYGVTGTLNLADLSQRVAQLPAPDAPLVGAAAMLLLVVFGLKAAVFPLYFWLPKAYAAATPPVAALFAIMTKVGIYSILRIYTQVFGDTAGPLADLANGWLWPAALLTLVLGTIGALAASTLNGLISYLLVVSVGTLLAGLALDSHDALVGSLYYLIHSTWVCGALFLFAGIISRCRGPRFVGRLVPGPALSRPTLLSGLFFLAAISVIGLPPLSGFVGKLLLLRAAETGVAAGWLYSLLLGSGLVSIIAFSRAGSTLFWRTDPAAAAGGPVDNVRLAAVLALLLCSPLLVVFAGPLLDYLTITVDQLLDPQEYARQVLSMQISTSGGGH
ncbi:monovalent cation/H+ antiporter subunit D [Halopseudomonas bauzanensis]|uniref:Multisubunit potassium/proton antiporter, PhaD subunit n=1 Tax=Halopseudomonas bauzanensis TaxID=653930 RepID=A0A1H9V7Z9_9GAMM|nr:monovalent cation/H+ antiporter subunit D [Halopseudomonas bauzanensis]SES17792.1 multisubunit potassium/proton antiporter, PhaD subunit [Halopseudomonas bauzanensis]SFM18427.1 multisubunit potassium/proton antiporter, PhaD subunit (TC 2.A.63.1.1) [Halopseudomonas bauzanensis]